MKYTNTVIIGAGQAGLAMSKHLADRSIDHVLLERGEVANSWKQERWDSLRLLTPNWQCKLPGYCYSGSNPDGFMTMPEVTQFLDRYADKISAPVQTQTTVRSVRRVSGGYHIATSQGNWQCAALVLANGACNIANVPVCAEAVPTSVRQITPMDYKSPSQLEDGGVLVVGASATGMQLAEEIQQSGRQVTLSVGEHIRVPRSYRGRDIKWWMDAVGLLDLHYREVDDLNRVRHLPSLQLVGSTDNHTLDINSLREIGVEIVGRFVGVNNSKGQFSGALRNVCSMSDLKMNRMLDAIDEWVDQMGNGADFAPPKRFAPTTLDPDPRLGLDLTDGSIKTILWATGYRPDYSWLDVPVFDHKGRLKHDGGVVDAPGMYVLGLPFMRRRKSTLICGADGDAAFIAEHLSRSLMRTAA